jgi:hypothetical protein
MRASWKCYLCEFFIVIQQAETLRAAVAHA